MIGVSAMRRSALHAGPIALLALALVTLQPNALAAATIALDITGGSTTICLPQPNPGCTIGWAFQVNDPIRVFQLGVFDFGSNGLTDPHDVGLWNAGGSLLASTTVTNASTPAASTDALGRWLFASISPIDLGPGTYRIGAFYLNEGSDVFLSSSFVPVVTSTIPQITYLGGRGIFSVTSLSDPTGGPFAGFEPSLFGPTMTAEPVPEPLTLLLIGSGGLAMLRRRMRHVS